MDRSSTTYSLGERCGSKGKQKKLYIADNDFKGTRVVFEWNDGEAEFELQFVNPGKQYHIWKHSLADNPELIAREKTSVTIPGGIDR